MPPRCQSLAGRLSSNALAIRTAHPSQRTYATTTGDAFSDAFQDTPEQFVRNPLKRRKGGDLGTHLPRYIIPKNAHIPAYPYGEYQLYKQANKGLYGGQMIQHGNNVSKRTETKTRRVWTPNVLSKSLYSVALKKRVKLRITAAVLKTIDREGGLDEYLLKDSPHRIKELGPMGWALRWTLMQTPEVITRLRDEAAALGIEQDAIDKQWPTPTMVNDSRMPEYKYWEDASAVVEDQALWESDDRSGPANRASSWNDRQVARIAEKEYNSAIFAADRYVKRSFVDTEEAAIKLAFIRVKERAEAAEKLKQQFQARLDEIPPQDLEEWRKRLELPADLKEAKLRKIVYNQSRRAQINELGSVKAWEESKQKVFEERMAAAGKVDQPPRTPEEKKAEYAELIHEAEYAETNGALSEERKEFLADALKKAQKVIDAKASSGEIEYVRWRVEVAQTLRENKGSQGLEETGSGNDLSSLTGGEGEDGWKQVVDASQKAGAGESRPNA